MAERTGSALQKLPQWFDPTFHLTILKMDFENKYIEELIDERKLARENKEWKLSDEIRNYLDEKFVFVFDVKDNDGKPFQEVHYLYGDYFNKIETIERLYKIKFKSKREFVEWNIKQDISRTKRLDSWIYSMQSSN